MSSKYTEYHVQLINARTGKTIDDDTGRYIVLTAGEAQPQPTIYSDKYGTAITYTAAQSSNLITDGEISFWTPNTVATVDLTIVTASGHAVFVAGLTPSDHRVEVNEEAVRQVLVTPYYASIAGLTATASIWGNGLSIPAKSVVHDVFLRSTVLGTTSTINVGISGTPTGLYVGALAGGTGFLVDEPIITKLTASNNIGALLVGANATNTSYRRSHPVPAITGIVWAEITSTVLAAQAGYVYIVYDVFQTA